MNRCKIGVYSKLYENYLNMKKLIITTTFSIAIFATGFAQTKKIAHRSHGGAVASLILSTPDNLGERRMPEFDNLHILKPSPAVVIDSGYLEKFICPVDSITPETAPAIDEGKTEKQEEIKENEEATPANKVKPDSIASNVQVIGDLAEAQSVNSETQMIPMAEPVAEASEGSTAWVWLASLAALSLLLLASARMRKTAAVNQQ